MLHKAIFLNSSGNVNKCNSSYCKSNINISCNCVTPFDNKYNILSLPNISALYPILPINPVKSKIGISPKTFQKEQKKIV